MIQKITLLTTATILCCVNVLLGQTLPKSQTIEFENAPKQSTLHEERVVILRATDAEQKADLPPVARHEAAPCHDCPFLGIYMDETPNKNGVLVLNAIKGSAAQLADLKDGDIIVQFGSLPTPDTDALTAALATHKSGDVVKVVYLRMDARREASIKLLSKPRPKIHIIEEETRSRHAQLNQGKCRKTETFESPWLGVEIVDAPNETGALVEKVFEKTAAEAMGIQKGDIIQQINDKNIANINELIANIKTRKPKERLAIQLLRQAKEINLKGRLGSKQQMRLVWHDCNQKSEQTAAQEKKLSQQSTLTNTPTDFSKTLDLSPNPTQGIFHFSITTPKNTTPLYMEIIDAEGRQIHRETITTNEGNIFTGATDISHATNGIYFVTFKQDGKLLATKKILLNRSNGL